MQRLMRAVFPDGRQPHSRRLSMDPGNYHFHCSKASDSFFAGNDIVRVPDPTDGRDLAIEDF
jgi:hypothetical protein